MANLQLVGNIGGSEAATVKLTVVYLTDYRDEQGRVPPPVLLFEKLPGQEWTAQPNGGAAIVLGPDQIGIPAPRVSVTYSLLREGLPPLARTLERYIVPNTDPAGFWDFTRADGNGIYNGSPDNLTQVNVLPGQGPQGTPGPGLRVGTGVPSPGLGINGDSYLNTLTWDMYVRGGGAWTLIGNIRGGAGGVGAQGLPGVDGRSFPVPTTSQAGYLPVADGSQPSGFSWTSQSALKLRKLGDVDITGIQDGQTLIWSSASNRFVPGQAGGTPDPPEAGPITGAIIQWPPDQAPDWSQPGTLKQYGLGDDTSSSPTDVWGYTEPSLTADMVLSITYSNGFTENISYQGEGLWTAKQNWQFTQFQDGSKPTILINVAQGVFISSVNIFNPQQGGPVLPGEPIPDLSDFVFKFPSGQYEQATAEFPLTAYAYAMTATNDNPSPLNNMKVVLEQKGPSGVWSAYLQASSIPAGQTFTDGPRPLDTSAVAWRVRCYRPGSGEVTAHISITPSGDPDAIVTVGGQVVNKESFVFAYSGNAANQHTDSFRLTPGRYTLNSSTASTSDENPASAALEFQSAGGSWQIFLSNSMYLTPEYNYPGTPTQLDDYLYRFSAYRGVSGQFTANISLFKQRLVKRDLDVTNPASFDFEIDGSGNIQKSNPFQLDSAYYTMNCQALTDPGSSPIEVSLLELDGYGIWQKYQTVILNDFTPTTAAAFFVLGTSYRIQGYCASTQTALVQVELTPVSAPSTPSS